MKLSAYEAETIIDFNEEDGRAVLYTASKRVKAYLDKEGLQPKKVEFDCDTKPVAWFYDLPRSAVRIKVSKRSLNIGGNASQSINLAMKDAR